MFSLAEYVRGAALASLMHHKGSGGSCVSRARTKSGRFGRFHPRRIRDLLLIACITAASLAAQTAREALGAPAIEPLTGEPPAKIIIDPPLADHLSHGRVVIQYRALNLHIAPVFGPAALAVSPRVGHLHVTLDDSPWVWADVSGEPVILVGLPPGPHKVRLQLESPVHEPVAEGSVRFTVPPQKSQPAAATAQPRSSEPPAKLILASPLAEALSRGVVFVVYRTENLHVLPLYGPAALEISPRVGHLHVSVDGAPWHWVSASGSPVVIQGLPPGPHQVLIQLADALHRTLDQGVVQVTIPPTTPLSAEH